MPCYKLICLFIEQGVTYKKITPYLYIYKSFSHFLPLLVCDQITSAEPMTLVIKKIIVNASILLSF
nr:MAG TPA: hypothetical protein [Caudoviricetes sp.]